MGHGSGNTLEIGCVTLWARHKLSLSQWNDWFAWILAAPGITALHTHHSLKWTQKGTSISQPFMSTQSGVLNMNSTACVTLTQYCYYTINLKRQHRLVICSVLSRVSYSMTSVFLNSSAANPSCPLSREGMGGVTSVNAVLVVKLIKLRRWFCRRLRFWRTFLSKHPNKNDVCKRLFLIWTRATCGRYKHLFAKKFQ